MKLNIKRKFKNLINLLKIPIGYLFYAIAKFISYVLLGVKHIESTKVFSITSEYMYLISISIMSSTFYALVTRTIEFTFGMFLLVVAIIGYEMSKLIDRKLAEKAKKDTDNIV